MQMTVMSEGLLLNSKYIKMGREEGGFQAVLIQLPIVIVCYEFIICDGLKCREMKYVMSSKVGN